MKIIEKEFNVITGETTITERDETPVEIEARAKREEERAEEQAELQARVAARQPILDRLGLTAEEAQLLLGGN